MSYFYKYKKYKKLYKLLAGGLEAEFKKIAREKFKWGEQSTGSKKAGEYIGEKDHCHVHHSYEPGMGHIKFDIDGHRHARFNFHPKDEGVRSQRRTDELGYNLTSNNIDHMRKNILDINDILTQEDIIKNDNNRPGLETLKEYKDVLEKKILELEQKKQDSTNQFQKKKKAEEKQKKSIKSQKRASIEAKEAQKLKNSLDLLRQHDKGYQESHAQFFNHLHNISQQDFNTRYEKNSNDLFGKKKKTKKIGYAKLKTLYDKSLQKKEVPPCLRYKNCNPELFESDVFRSMSPPDSDYLSSLTENFFERDPNKLKEHLNGSKKINAHDYCKFIGCNTCGRKGINNDYSYHCLPEDIQLEQKDNSRKKKLVFYDDDEHDQIHYLSDAESEEDYMYPSESESSTQTKEQAEATRRGEGAGELPLPK